MAYTVKKLSELSGVTIRTLHYYEEEGLLKPAYYGSNGYRYYEKEQLLQLQQILFFKELGFTIKQIKKVLGKDDFDQLSALLSHKNSLSQELQKIKILLKTIDKTINHLRGKKQMKEQEIFNGFNISLIKKASANATYALAEELVIKSVRNPTKNIKDVEERGKDFYKNIEDNTYSIFKELTHCLEKGRGPNAKDVQNLIEKHHSFANTIQNATKEVYTAMAQLYREHPEFRKQIDPFHPKLAEYMAQAMLIFSETKL